MTEAAKFYELDFNGNTRGQTFSHIALAFGIDGINLPVLLLDGDVRVLASNAMACKLYSRKQSEINGRLLGDVLGCTHALEPGGCGETFHCASCAIRLTVNYTMVTDEECREVPVYQAVDSDRQDINASFMISTKKVFNTVFLTIHEVNKNVTIAL
jgi:hypothetical protein